MHISALNVRIVFQRNETLVDTIGNHRNLWTDYFSCYATVSGQSGDETEEAGQTLVSEKVSFTVRYSSETATIVPDGFRILLADRIYNILSVDNMAFKHNSLKFRAELVRR
ncbi:SPP1 family predicted phage head-tail adaptor [Kineothrix alysoides]|uniref:SPP1 family predicted phage head-tail adaptor n=1 Tax=Kineothrix alysoides TaxID=1469948 RepID=A0A4R1R5K4_9FIRM|nr:phage head closure protein [Kineothrix alysoides]TCL60572.1 SPP1 family predicted phage head-tail adaptor [Kineothrix alysoides]